MNIGGVHSLLVQGFEEKVHEEIRNLGDEILLHTITDLLTDKDRISSSYISSNSVLEDRMGSIISMLTAYGIAVEGTRNALHIESLSNTLGSKRPFPLIITPKRAAKIRSRIFQRIYELLTAFSAINNEEKIFFNWNYNALVRETSLLEKTLLSRLIKEEDSSIGKEFTDIIRQYLKYLAGNIRENIPRENARESLKHLVGLLPKAYNDLFEHVASMKIFAGNRFDDIIDYITIVVERSIFEILLHDLLEKARKEHVNVFWVTSNPDDNYISRTNYILSWINDTVILTYIWRNLDQAVLDVKNIVGEDLDNTYNFTFYLIHKYLFTNEHKLIKIGDYSSIGRVLWSKKGLWYAKFSRYGPIIQLIHIGEYKDSTITEGLRELFTVSDKRSGYPRPLVLVRRACRISEEVARGLGDSLLRRIDNPLLKAILHRKHSMATSVF